MDRVFQEVMRYGIRLRIPLRYAGVVTATRVVRDDYNGNYLEVFLEPAPPPTPPPKTDVKETCYESFKSTRIV